MQQLNLRIGHQDIASDMAGSLIAEWKKTCHDPKLKAEMQTFEDSNSSMEDVNIDMDDDEEELL